MRLERMVAVPAAGTPRLDLFRFVVQRPIQRTREDNWNGRLIPALPLDTGGHPWVETHAWRKGHEAGELLVTQAQAYISSGDFVDDPRRLEVPLASLDAWLVCQQDRPTAQALRERVKALAGVEVEAFVASDRFRQARRRLGYSLVALVVAGPTMPLAGELYRLLQVAALLEPSFSAAGALTGRAVTDGRSLGDGDFPVRPGQQYPFLALMGRPPGRQRLGQYARGRGVGPMVEFDLRVSLALPLAAGLALLSLVKAWLLLRRKP